jgi:hypothetical protein
MMCEEHLARLGLGFEGRSMSEILKPRTGRGHEMYLRTDVDRGEEDIVK